MQPKAAQFTDMFIPVDADPRKKGGNLRAQPAFGLRVTFNDIAENVAHLRFHTAAILSRTLLQALFDDLLDIPDDDLCHS